MTSQSSATAGLGPVTQSGTLLVITPGKVCAAHAELVRHLSSTADARACPLGGATRTDLAAILSGNPLHVVAVPLSLGPDDPLLADLTGLLRWARTRWPAMTFLQSAPFGTPQHMVGWASRQARTALRHSHGPVPPAGTALLVVGAGGAPAANAEVCAVARLLWETHDYELVEAAFARDARPTARDGIDRLVRLGARRVVVLPLALLDDPMYQAVRAQVANISGSEVVLARPLLTPEAVAAVVRRRYEDALARWSLSGDDGLSPVHSHGPTDDPERGSDDILPPRYRGGQAVSSARMSSSAPLTYDAEGRVAWDRVWRGFCHLALAGGPPHRGKLLEPPSRDEVLADPDASARVAAEIARGLSLVTRLPTVTDAAPGWVGLVCPDEEMAIWLLRAIVVENVSVRREGATLFLPAGPAYRIEKEIKNVITAVAKTHHYWTEHRAAR
jgi:sirohydrochlorin cobaltochelatase